MALFNKKEKQKKEKEKPQRKPLEIWYTEDGTKIGDDGYPMTPILHQDASYLECLLYLRNDTFGLGPCLYIAWLVFR